MIMLRTSRTRKLLQCLSVAYSLLIMALFVSGCGGGGSATAGMPEPQSNPVPTVASVTPSMITTADVGTKGPMTGSGFPSSSSLTWNGVAHASTYVSATEIQFTLTASDLTAVGTAQVVV